MYTIKKENLPFKLKGKKMENGESMVEKMRRMLKTNEPIKAEVNTSYTDRKEGVRPVTDIRTDRFKLVNSGIDKATSEAILRRMPQLPKNEGEDFKDA